MFRLLTSLGEQFRMTLNCIHLQSYTVMIPVCDQIGVAKLIAIHTVKIVSIISNSHKLWPISNDDRKGFSNCFLLDGAISQPGIKSANHSATSEYPFQIPIYRAIRWTMFGRRRNVLESVLDTVTVLFVNFFYPTDSSNIFRIGEFWKFWSF